MSKSVPHLAHKPVPDSEYYGVSVLELSPAYTRQTYLTTFGSPAPNWNPAVIIKRWSDPLAKVDQVYRYRALRKNLQTGAPEIYEVAISGALAAAPVNLPGMNNLEAYKPAPTTAYIHNDYAGNATIPAETLSTYSQAMDLAMELLQLLNKEEPNSRQFSVQLVNQVYEGPFSIIYPDDEPRRIWNLQFTREGDTPFQHNVGRLLGRRHADGVNNEGKWEVSYQASPGQAKLGYQFGWKNRGYVDTGMWDFRPELPIPIRLLHAEEEIIGQLTGSFLVRRTQVNFAAQAVMAPTEHK